MVLGAEPLTIDPAIPREGSASLDSLLAEPPDAAVVSASGERAFFRASVALERGVGRVVVREGAMPAEWVSELAARAAVLGGAVFVRGDERYARAAAAERIEVAAPSFDADPTPSCDGAPLPLLEVERSLRCEEVAFALGLKPVLYLVAGASEVTAIRARYSGAIIAERGDRVTSGKPSGERVYGAGEPVAHLFIGERAEDAAELWAKGSSQNVEELGALMGYPRCCVRAFAAMSSRRINAAFPYVSAARTRALDGHFDALLDTTVERLIPFTPCTYGCARALEWAAQVSMAANIKREARGVLFIDEDRIVSFDEAVVEGERVRYRGARWAGAPNDRQQRAFGGLLGSSGVLELAPLAANGRPLARGVFLPFSRSQSALRFA